MHDKYYHIKTIMVIIILSVLSCSPKSIWTNNNSTNNQENKNEFYSWKELRDRNIVKQKYDYSCGAASLATYLQFYFGDRITEEQIVNDILPRLDKTKRLDRKKKGFSIADLEDFANRRGYTTMILKNVQLSKISKIKGPFLTLIHRDGIYHFVIIRGVKEDRIYIADPSIGNIRIAADLFVEEWLGIIMAIGKKGFGLPTIHPLAIKENTPVRNELDAIRFK